MKVRNIKLRRLEERDLELVLSWRNSYDVRKNMYTSHEITFNEHEAWYGEVKKDTSKLYFIAELDDKPIGVIGFTDINREAKIASWAFYASPVAPKGAGSLMEFRALEYSFTVLGLYKLQCEILEFNQLVIKLHQKFNFKIEGTHRKAFFNGEEYYDVIHMGLFSHEWESIRDSMKNKLRVEDE